MTSPEILRIIVETNLAAGAAVAGVVLLRRPARRWLGPRAAYALWAAVPLSAAAVLAPSPWLRTLEAPVLPSVIINAPLVLEAPVQAAAPLDMALVLLALWAIGAVALGLVLAFGQYRYLSALGRLSVEGPMRRAGAGGIGPSVIGAFFPRIVLPADFESRFAADEREMILAHEHAHIRAGDAQINAVVAAVRCAAWFNPLVHLAAHLLRIDQELACDATVLARHPERRRLYAEALLKTQLAVRPLPFGCTWPSRAVDPLKERIAMLKQPQPSRGLRRMGAIGVTLVAAGFAAGAWALQPARVGQASPGVFALAAAPVPSPTPAPQSARPSTPAPTAGGVLNLQLLIESGDDIIARPRLVVEAGQSGSFRVGGEIPVRGPNGQTQLAPDGVTVEVVNGVNGQAQVTVKLQDVAAGQPRKTETAVTLRTGEQRTVDMRGPEGKPYKVTFNALVAPASVSLTNALPNRQAPGATPPQRPTVITNPQWLARPSPEDLLRAAPDMAPGTTARAVLNCNVSETGGLINCQVLSETPGTSVGEAAQQLAERFRMAPTTRDGAPVGGSQVNVPITFVDATGPVSISGASLSYSAATGTTTVQGGAEVTSAAGTVRGETMIAGAGGTAVMIGEAR